MARKPDLASRLLEGPMPGKLPRLSPEHLFLAAVLGISGGGSWLGNDRLAEEMKETRAVISQMAASLEETSRSLAVAVSKIQDHDRRLENLETLYLRRQ